MTSRRDGPELVWPNKDRNLRAHGPDGYMWSDAAAPDATLKSIGWVGSDDAEPSGLVVVGDSLDALVALSEPGREEMPTQARSRVH